MHAAYANSVVDFGTPCLRRRHADSHMDLARPWAVAVRGAFYWVPPDWTFDGRPVPRAARRLLGPAGLETCPGAALLLSACYAGRALAYPFSAARDLDAVAGSLRYSPHDLPSVLLARCPLPIERAEAGDLFEILATVAGVAPWRARLVRLSARLCGKRMWIENHAPLDGAERERQ